MDHDPVVEETRAAGRALEAAAPGDVHAFFELLRRAQERYRDRVVSDESIVAESLAHPDGRGPAHRG